ncbi:coiled-coil domain-containing protein 137-like [Pollicipes pollicipes]|uniref:coiled-coil domain-containing protein 137-like n=1 Tax=Pollicipes pollicipes TaxID=41117 RepID=UPI001884F060|nr:coiled-coil domain-containing protein 137-like [Pollicipes pollicipes]
MAKRAHGKKATKIKDPYAIRRERDRGKIFNRKPTNAEDEFVPRKVQDMMKLVDGECNGMKMHNKKRRKQLKNGRITSKAFVDIETPEKGMSRPLKPIPLFEQRPNESDFKFLRRVEKMTKERIQQSKFEDKYNVDIVPDPVTGKTKMISREDERQQVRRKKKNVSEDGEEIPKKINRKKAKKIKRQQKLAGKMDDFAHLKDSVEFGEVVHRPPELKAAPKKAPSDGTQGKPGRKSLLLKKLYTNAQAGLRPSSAPKSLHQKASLEEERLRAVAAYRHLKQQKIEKAAKS